MESQRRATVVGTLLVLAAITTWGVYFPFAKIVLKKISPASFLIIRLGVGAAALLLLRLRLRRPLALRPSDWLFVLAAGFVGIVLHQLLQLNSLKLTSATNVGWILTLNPPVAGILGWFWLRERVAFHKIVGLVIAMFGIAVLVSRGDLSGLSFVSNWGDFLSLLTVGTFSVYTVMLKSRLTRYEPLTLAMLHMLLGFVVFGIVGGSKFLPEVIALSGSDWIITILIGILPSGLAYYWWTAGLKRLSVIDTSMILFIEAIVASVSGWLVLDETFTVYMLLGALIIIGGIWVAQSRWLDRTEWAWIK